MLDNYFAEVVPVSTLNSGKICSYCLVLMSHECDLIGNIVWVINYNTPLFNNSKTEIFVQFIVEMYPLRTTS